MKILSINAGSSSLKFTAFEMPEEKTLLSGYFERIGVGKSFYTIKKNGEKKRIEIEINNHIETFQLLIKELLENNIVKDLNEIKALAHRIVHGAEFFSDSMIITDEVIKKAIEVSPIAPLHNPPAIVGVTSAIKTFPNAIQTASFDTSFHQTMKKENYLYALPLEWYEKYHIRRYGMHGISYKYIASYAEKIFGRKDTKLIVCHIGSGASVCAIENGKSVNTSMGLTPNAGCIMGTRCGDVDTTIIPYIMKQANLRLDEVMDIMNKESGLLGISGKYSDMREIEENSQAGDENSILALNMYIRRIVDYIAKYYFELKGCDAIILTAGIGENGFFERNLIVEQLNFLGIKINKEVNESIASFFDIHEGKITTEDSTIPIYVVPTNEEIMMSRDAYELINK